MTHEVDGFQISQAEPRSEPRKYDLAAMDYQPDADEIMFMFYWGKTPQGGDFWIAQHNDGLTDEGRAALAEMRAQWERENGNAK